MEEQEILCPHCRRAFTPAKFVLRDFTREEHGTRVEFSMWVGAGTAWQERAIALSNVEMVDEPTRAPDGALSYRQQEREKVWTREMIEAYLQEQLERGLQAFEGREHQHAADHDHS